MVHADCGVAVCDAALEAAMIPKRFVVLIVLLCSGGFMRVVHLDDVLWSALAPRLQVVWADDFVYGDEGGLTRYIESIDPSKAPPGGTPVSKTDTPAQRALLHTVPLRYLKVVGGLAVEKTQAEKDSADAADASVRAERQAWVNEITNQDICAAASPAEVIALIDAFYDAEVAAMTTDITAVTNIATAKAALVTVAQQVSQQRMYIKKLARCLRALLKVRP
jgi:hypothetical protein